MNTNLSVLIIETFEPATKRIDKKDWKVELKKWLEISFNNLEANDFNNFEAYTSKLQDLHNLCIKLHPSNTIVHNLMKIKQIDLKILSSEDKISLNHILCQ